MSHDARVQEILALRSQGMTLAKIAARYELSIAEVVIIIEAEKRRRRAMAYQDRHGGV